VLFDSLDNMTVIDNSNTVNEEIQLLLTRPEEQGDRVVDKAISSVDSECVEEVDWGITSMDKHLKQVGEDRENMEDIRRSTDPEFPIFEPVHQNSTV